MIKEFIDVVNEIRQLLPVWESKLLALSVDDITKSRNNQHRNIKQIIGHMVDSASNNTHRVIHLQYQPCPFEFPNYATYGNNDRWIEIQDYETENWENLVQFWKYIHLHFVHVIENIQDSKLDNKWITDSSGTTISLREMVIDFLKHFNLHLNEIADLIIM